MTRTRKWMIVVAVVAVCILGLHLAWPFLERTISKLTQPKASNGSQINIAVMQYRSEHDGRYPASFGVLLKEGYLTSPHTFCSPHMGSEVPDDFPTGDLRKADVAALDRVQDFGDYALAGLPKDERSGGDWDWIVVYEKRNIYDNLRGCFFSDGHPEWLPEAEFQKRMAEQNARIREGRGKRFE